MVQPTRSSPVASRAGRSVSTQSFAEPTTDQSSRLRSNPSWSGTMSFSCISHDRYMLNVFSRYCCAVRAASSLLLPTMRLREAPSPLVGDRPISPPRLAVYLGQLLHIRPCDLRPKEDAIGKTGRPPCRPLALSAHLDGWVRLLIWGKTHPALGEFRVRA